MSSGSWAGKVSARLVPATGTSMKTPKPTSSTTARIAAGHREARHGRTGARRSVAERRAAPPARRGSASTRLTSAANAPDQEPRGDRHRDREHAGERDEHEAGDEQHEQPVPVRRVERVEQQEPEERLRQRDLERGEVVTSVDAGEEHHHDHDGQRPTARCASASGRVPARAVADRECHREADHHRDPEGAAARALAHRGDGGRHHRDAHEDPERDDVLRRCSRGDRRRRAGATVAPAGNGPSAGGPTTARARRRPTCKGVGTDAEARSVDLGGRELAPGHRPERVVGHARGARGDRLRGRDRGGRRR